MPGIEWTFDWQALMPEAANLLWLIAIIVGAFAAGGLALFGVETRHAFGEPGDLLPGSEIMGFGRPVRVRRPGIILRSHETPSNFVHAAANDTGGGAALT